MTLSRYEVIKHINLHELLLEELQLERASFHEKIDIDRIIKDLKANLEELRRIITPLPTPPVKAFDRYPFLWKSKD